MADADQRAPLLPPERRQQVEQPDMLEGPDAAAADLAMRTIAGAPIAPFLKPLSARLLAAGDQTVIALARSGNRHAEDLRGLWPQAGPDLRLRIAQYLAAIGHPPPDGEDASAVMQALALAARLDQSPEAAQSLAVMAAGDQAIAKALLPLAAASPGDSYTPILTSIARHHPALQDAVLKAAAAHGARVSTGAVLPDDVLERATQSADATQRAMGYQLAARAGWPAGRIASALADTEGPVRQAAITALRGNAAAAAATPLLRSETAATRLAAIEVLGQAQATDTLFTYLHDTAFPRIASYGAWRHALSTSNEAWAGVARLAMAEADRAAIDEVLVTLAALGHEKTVRYVRRFLGARDERMRDRAAEAITAIDQRRLVTPLLPLLDGVAARGGKPMTINATIEAMKTSALPWLRIAADAARPQESGMPDDERGLLDRLLFLRRVAIFESCSLDDLHAIHLVMTRADYLDGETIMKAGAQGEQLFVLLDGTVKVGKSGAQDFVEFATLKAGSAFGEMALFGDGTRTADVVAVGAVACLVLERSHFEDLTRQRPDILMQICRVFGGRLFAANQKLASALVTD